MDRRMSRWVDKSMDGCVGGWMDVWGVDVNVGLVDV